LVVYYWTGSAPAAKEIRDISSTGLFVLTEDRWLLGTLIMITLQSANTSNDEAVRSITLLARVVRHEEDGIALNFVTPNSNLSRQEKDQLDVLTVQRELDEFMASVSSNVSETSIVVE